jgi:hypothetical protein
MHQFALRPPRQIMKFFSLLFLLAIWPSCVFAQEQGLYKDQFGVITSISNEELIPFSTKQAPTTQEHKTAIQKFYSVKQCLEQDERPKTQPNLLKFNWGSFESTQEADICLFRIATSYAEISSFVKWLEYYGFTVQTLKGSTSTQKKFLINAYRPHKNQKPLFLVGFLDKLFNISYSYAIQIHIDENGSILSIKSHLNIL